MILRRHVDLMLARPPHVRVSSRPSVWIAASLMAILLSASCSDGACSLESCPHALYLEFHGQIPDTFTVTATGEWPYPVTDNRLVVKQCTMGSPDCGYVPEDGIDIMLVWVEVVAPTVNVTVEWGDTSAAYVFRPDWTKTEPNEPWCGECWHAREILRF